MRGREEGIVLILRRFRIRERRGRGSQCALAGVSIRRHVGVHTVKAMSVECIKYSVLKSNILFYYKQKIFLF